MGGVHPDAREGPRVGADARRVAVRGDSAGGNRATVVAIRAAQHRLGAPAAQLLFYPAGGLTQKRPSHWMFTNGPFLLVRSSTGSASGTCRQRRRGEAPGVALARRRQAQRAHRREPPGEHSAAAPAHRSPSSIGLPRGITLCVAAAVALGCASRCGECPERRPRATSGGASA
ncbi:MAG: alpha/beta hydrolase [Actinomycetota bacterium]|nr:alpha/beta hydrolase [Actinomycetota bacterium]